MTADITGIHHIGLVVRDMEVALETFRHLGFRLHAPAYPALPPKPGEAPEPVGAGNSHADFPRSFIEVLAFAPKDPARLPESATLVPLSVPDERLAATRAVLKQTLGGLARRLGNGEGAHILVFTTRDAAETAERMASVGVRTSGALGAQRPITTADGVRLAGVRFLEVHDAASAAFGMVAEGRVGAAEDAPAALLDAQTGLDHPNGAVGVAEVLMCVDDDRRRSTIERYSRYLDRTPESEGSASVFDLGASRLVLTTARDAAERLPGSAPRHVPGLAAYGIAVRDLETTVDHLRSRGVHLRRTADGRPFVPAAAAHGAAVVFQQA
ncbi:Glyoxalase-like domain-containing protein [Glycomyces sambucus]|uniref:Glyoxalase-like domain-containing protein n=1 Tax=Glycomyces sambucus TaxID=380244 RepID=A0A1G9FH45_9ACTN|nr:VOC family protein [Glycomyces sambucus]SDK87672.1 Glyoxalase-like domain-containing protein [Glycomyces sambucus]